jgi:hypothetical protein
MVMAEQSGRVRVRVVTHSLAVGLQGTINSVLYEEQENGAEVIDIKLASMPAGGDSQFGSTQGEHVALIILRSPLT